MKKAHQKILIVAAHPDDEVLGCGGTVAKLSREGTEIHLLTLGEGITSRDFKRNPEKRESELKELKESTEKVADILGIKKIYFVNLPDNRFDTVALLDIVKKIEKIKNKFKSNIIFTHHKNDLNIDHRITFEAVMTASRPLKGERVKEIYSFEVPSSTEWSIVHLFSPNVFVDIKATFNKKIKALKAYKSEIRQYPHPRSIQAVEIIARRWGTVVGKELVEALELIREIK
jgi:LmbE family N-acetylglucosaminyl deacetylase